VLIKLGKNEGAIKVFDKTLSLDPKNVAALCNKAVALAKLGKYLEAEQCKEKASQLNPVYSSTIGKLYNKVSTASAGGSTWKSASIKDPLSKYTWVVWTAVFVPTATESNYKIVVRATDKTGKVQTAEVRPPYPDGATGYHIINV